MIRNYIKTAFRSLKRNKGFTAINILGLALGLATCLLLVIYVVDELSYDSYNLKADRIYRVNNDVKFGGVEKSYASSPAPLAKALMLDNPDVEATVRLRQRGSYEVKKGNQSIPERNVIFADSGLFDVFTLAMLSGNPKTALTEPKTAVITESIAQKYFNTTQAVGKTLDFNNGLYKVTGVIKDMPKQSHFSYDIFLSMISLEESREDAWFSNNFNTYVLLKPNADVHKLEAQLQPFLRKQAGPQMESILHLDFNKFESAGNYYRLNLTPLKDIHLRSARVSELGPNGSIQYVYIFTCIAVLVLLIACVNFMNLSTARSANRAREVGVRKVLGSARKFLIAQFLSESVIVTLIAAGIAIVAAILLLPAFNQMAGKTLAVTPSLVAWLLPAILAAVLFIGCLAGSYPAFFLSGFRPADVLKGKLSAGFKGGRMRSFLVVFQFSISIILIIGTLVIYNQLKYIQNKDLGYNRDQVLVIHHTETLGGQAKTFKNEIKQLAGVKNATMTGFTPTIDYRNNSTLFPDRNMNQDHAVNSQIWEIDEDYMSTLGLKMLSGRNFSADMPTDSDAIIVNEAAVKLMGVQNALGKELFLPMDNLVKNLRKLHIIGVVKNFNFNSLRENITPVAFMLNEETGALSIKLSTANVAPVIAQVQNKWNKLSAGHEFNYSFMDDDFDATYRTEQRMGTIFITFTTLAIIIASLGLFGLAAYAAEQRTKEIGIRKVLGASVTLLVGLLSKDFIKLVLIAIVIATPVAYIASQQWLQGFAYRQEVQWWIIALAGVISLLIAFVTISFQSIKAALANPVKSLKSE